MPTMTITVKIPTRITREGDVYVADCPLLDVVTQGCTKDLAVSVIQSNMRTAGIDREEYFRPLELC